jgi:hypothetical protein
MGVAAGQKHIRGNVAALSGVSDEFIRRGVPLSFGEKSTVLGVGLIVDEEETAAACRDVMESRAVLREDLGGFERLAVEGDLEAFAKDCGVPLGEGE